LLEALTVQFPQITSLYYFINAKANDSISDLPPYHVHGSPFLTESMEDLQFKVGPKSFFQTNSRQALHLYRVVRSFASLSGNELLYDLYTGTGTIALFLARQCRQVGGIEYVEEAIEDARLNARHNGIDNVLFFAGDMRKTLDNQFFDRYGKPDVIVTDPPRSGMHPDVLQAILVASPRRIVYVSCNPATQARDLSVLDIRYRVDRLQPVDMFPHTHHIENVALLLRRE